MKTPSIRYADDLKKWSELAEINGHWVCARPLSWGGLSLIWRLKLAFKVFTGKYDALVWKENQ